MTAPVTLTLEYTDVLRIIAALRLQEVSEMDSYSDDAQWSANLVRNIKAQLKAGA